MTTYYAYYNETGQVTSISNVPRTDGSMLEITEEVAMPFLLGKKNRHLYQVTAVTTDNKTVMQLVRIEEETTVPKVIVFGPASKFTTTQDVIIECNLSKKQWSLYLVNDADALIVDNMIVLFIVKETNHDIIVRALQVDAEEFAEKKVMHFPFIDAEEEQIDDLTILTKLVQDSYKLVITR